MKIARRQLLLSVNFVLLTLAVNAAPGQAATEVTFKLARGQSEPFITQIVVKSQGRIVLDVNSEPKNIEITLLLRRPDGTVASRIAGTGGNLSLSYFATQHEVTDSLTVGNLRWSVEISRANSDFLVSGRLKATHPGS